MRDTRPTNCVAELRSCGRDGVVTVVVNTVTQQRKVFISSYTSGCCTLPAALGGL